MFRTNMFGATWNDKIYPDEAEPPFNAGPPPPPPQTDFIDVDEPIISGGLKILPEPIKEFITFFFRSVKDGNVSGIENAYETGFPKLTDKYFQKQRWPTADDIASLVQNDEVVIILYKELYYRHIYAHNIQSGPSLDERFESYMNYIALFNLILNSDTPVDLELPNQWLWDIIDEFIYQFQSFTQYRAKLKQRSEEEIIYMRDSPKIWNVHSVLNVLHCLVEKSNINEQLRVFAERGDPETVAGDFGSHSLYKMLGFFSLVGLCRLHCLLGDYYQSLSVLENIDISRQEMYCRVPTCHITAAYYVGFSYMMMRRYLDAIRTFSTILVYLQRMRSSLRQDTQEYVTKQSDQMYTLLCICLTLHPVRVDEVVHQQLKEKFQDRLIRLQKMELQEFENSFHFGCPKFLSPIPPNYDMPGNNYQLEPYYQQLKIFMEEIEQQSALPHLRSYLKLYTTLPTSKLEALMDTVVTTDEEKEEVPLDAKLMCYKHKLQNVVWSQGGGLEGELQSGSDVDFYIDGEMIHVADTKVARRFGEFFIRQIAKLEEINKGIDSLTATIQQQQGPKA